MFPSPDGFLCQTTFPALKYIEIQDKPLKQAHNIWKSITHNTQDVKAGEIKVRISTQTYVLQDKRAKFDPSVSSVCKLCKLADEDMEHFLLICPNYNLIRIKHLNKIRDCLNSTEKNKYEDIVNEGKLLQLLMDCTSKKLICNPRCHTRIERISRDLCYELHKERNKQLEL